MVSGVIMCLSGEAQITVRVFLFDLQLLMFTKCVIKVSEMPEGLFYDEV